MAGNVINLLTKSLTWMQSQFGEDAEESQTAIEQLEQQKAADRRELLLQKLRKRKRESRDGVTQTAGRSNYTNFRIFHPRSPSSSQLLRSCGSVLLPPRVDAPALLDTAWIPIPLPWNVAETGCQTEGKGSVDAGVQVGGGDSVVKAEEVDGNEEMLKITCTFVDEYSKSMDTLVEEIDFADPIPYPTAFCDNVDIDTADYIQELYERYTSAVKFVSMTQWKFNQMQYDLGKYDVKHPDYLEMINPEEDPQSAGDYSNDRPATTTSCAPPSLPATPEGYRTPPYSQWLSKPRMGPETHMMTYPEYYLDEEMYIPGELEEGFEFDYEMGVGLN